MNPALNIKLVVSIKTAKAIDLTIPEPSCAC
jgi:hypothetical protein